MRPARRAACLAIPSAVVHYGPALPAGLDQYAAPGNVIVVTAEQRNRNPARIRAWRAKGANVFAYVNLVDWRGPLDAIEQNLYGGSFPSSWFLGSYSNYPGTRLINLEDTSPVATYNGFTGTWGQYAARWVRNEVIQDGRLFNGVFLDVWGDQLYNVPVGGPGTRWDAGIAKWGQELRAQVGSDIFLIGNNTQSHATAAPLNGRMWESFDSRGSGWNDLTGLGVHPGLVHVFPWPEWRKPQLDILWRNEASPDQATKDMLVAAAQRVTVTGTDVAVGASDHQGGFPAPFGSGGSAPTSPTIPPAPPAPMVPRPTTPATPAPKPGAPAVVGGVSGVGAVTTVTVIAGAGPPITGKRLVLSSSPGRARPLEPPAQPRRDRHLQRLRVGRQGRPRHRPQDGRLRDPQHPGRRPQGHDDRRARARAEDPAAGRPRPRPPGPGRSDGHSRQVGVVRVASGDLRWAIWTRTASGARTGLSVSDKVLPLQTWVTLRATTDWSTPAGTDALRIGRDVVLRARAGVLADVGAARHGRPGPLEQRRRGRRRAGPLDRGDRQVGAPRADRPPRRPRRRLALTVMPQVRSVSSIQQRLRRSNPMIAVMRASLARNERASADQLRRYQERRLRAMVRWAARRSPFYRRWFDEAGVDPRSIRTLDDLPRLPLIERRHLAETPDDFLAYPKRMVWAAHSSGTSGTPMTVYRSAGSSMFEMAALQRQWGWFGISPGGGSVELRGSTFAGNDPEVVALHNVGAHRLLISSFRLSQEFFPAIWREITAFGPATVEGWPSSLALLASLIRDAGLTLPVRGIITSSELMSPAQIALMRSVYVGPIMDHYGQTERVVMAGGCEAGGYHLFPDYGIMELLPVPGTDGSTRSSAPRSTTGASRCCATAPATGWGRPPASPAPAAAHSRRSA